MTILGKHVTLTMGDGKCHNEGNVNRHPERMRRIYYRSEEGGMKIKAISCELSATSCKPLAASCQLKVLNDSGRH